MNSALQAILARLFVQMKLDARAAAKEAKDFERADAIREDLSTQGITINDTSAGSTWSNGHGYFSPITCLEDLKVVVENEIALCALRAEIDADRAAFIKKHDRPSTPPDYEVGE